MEMTEKKGEEVQEYIRVMLEATPIACVLLNRDLQILYCNDRNVQLFRLHGWEERKELRFFDLSPEFQPDGRKSAEKIHEILEKVFNQGHYTFEWMHQTTDGESLPVEGTLVRVPYGEDNLLAGYARDMREHQNIASGIRYRDHLLRTINRAAAILLRTEHDDFTGTLRRCMGMIAQAANADRIYLWKNHEENGRLYCSQVHEWSGKAPPLQNRDEIQNVLYDDLPPAYEILSAGRNINTLVRRLPPGNMREFLSWQGILSILLVPIFINDAFWGFVGFDNCATERRFNKTEETALHAASLVIANAMVTNAYLQDIRDASVRLEAALKEAEVANDAKSDFLAQMSHEMRTPLNAVIGLSRLALNEGDISRETRSSLERILNSGSMLLELINDLLDVSRIDAGKLELMPVEYDVPDLINEIVSQNILRVGEKPVRLVLDISSNLPMRLYGDELKIKQILNNLLSNALKFTFRGTVTFSMRYLQEDGFSWLVSRITDTGIGIRTEDMVHLFSKYVRLNKAFFRATEGTGLGLVIVKRLAEMMGGEVSVESEFGKGSVFTIKLRQDAVGSRTIGAETVENLKNLRYFNKELHGQQQQTRRPHARALAIDDIPANLEVIRGMIKPYGMKIDCMTSGQEAIEAIRAEKVRYDVIFMDQMMPGLDGVEATRIIREEIGTEYAKTIPIIAVTANAVVGNREMLLASGFSAFISKPVDPFFLDALIREWVPDKMREVMPLPVNEAPEKLPEKRFPWHLDGIDLQKGFERFGYDEESFTRILRAFAASTSSVLQKIREPDAENLADYAIIVHGIRGASHGIGANALGVMAQTLERTAKEGDWDFVAANNPAFLEAAEKLVADIESLPDKKTRDPKTKKDKPDRSVLSRLVAACENYDMDEIDAAMAEIESCEYESGGELALWLREKASQMKFGEIAEKLKNELRK